MIEEDIEGDIIDLTNSICFLASEIYDIKTQLKDHREITDENRNFVINARTALSYKNKELHSKKAQLRRIKYHVMNEARNDEDSLELTKTRAENLRRELTLVCQHGRGIAASFINEARWFLDEETYKTLLHLAVENMKVDKQYYHAVEIMKVDKQY